MNQIYLDNNSTTLIDPDVVQAITQCMSAAYANPASQHQFGQKSRRRLEEIRTDILELVGGQNRGMETDSLIFTSGGTESNNLALAGLAFEQDGSLPDKKRILVSSIEHPSVLATASYLETLGFHVEKIDCLENGVIDLDHLNTLLGQPVRLVSVMTVNHETGCIQPISQVSKMCSDANVLLHSDAVQAVGKMPVSFSELGVDAMSFTAHKLHGPKGIGGLVLRHGLKLFPRQFGGFQQQGFRPGTEDLCLATGMQIALRKFVEQADLRYQSVRKLNKQLENALISQCEAKINGSSSYRVPHTINASFSGIRRQEFLMAADMRGLAISTGSACASGSSDPSPVLQAMNLPADIVDSSIRISLSALTTAAETEWAIDRILQISKSLRA